jgi:uncharacterized protein (DUF302 family)
MNYYYSKSVKGNFDQVLKRVINALNEEAFGIITDIDVQHTLQAKLGVTFKKYRILGACNPLFAHKALLTEDKIGTMLPCNVIVQEKNENEIEVAAINPVLSMQAVKNTVLEDIAGQVEHTLKKAIDQI